MQIREEGGKQRAAMTFRSASSRKTGASVSIRQHTSASRGTSDESCLEDVSPIPRQGTQDRTLSLDRDSYLPSSAYDMRAQLEHTRAQLEHTRAYTTLAASTAAAACVEQQAGAGAAHAGPRPHRCVMCAWVWCMRP
jgi:hypothetical protein